MRVTQNAGNGISESSYFQNFPRAPSPNNIHIHLHHFFPLSLILVLQKPCDKTVSCKKEIRDGDSTLPRINISNICNCCLCRIGLHKQATSQHSTVLFAMV